MPSELRFGRHMFSGFYLPDNRKDRIVHSRHAVRDCCRKRQAKK
ncbi:hypothetical protein [Neisseria basseii]|nr:hypothetical protein [Neisseria basseii]